jgi:hypothetical protein
MKLALILAKGQHRDCAEAGETCQQLRESLMRRGM